MKGPKPATIISLVALFVALSGGAYAAQQARVAPKSIGPAKIKDDAVKPRHLSAAAQRNLGTQEVASDADVAALSGRVASLEEGTYQGHVLGLDPALYWTLGAEGTTDLSGNGRHGTGQGGIDVGGEPGSPIGARATEFDGSDDWIDSTYAPFVAGAELTLTAWVRRDTHAVPHTFVGSGSADGPWFGIEVNRQPNWGRQTGHLPSPSFGQTWPDDNDWHFIALTDDQATRRVDMYVDGQSVGAMFLNGSYASPAPALALGAWDSGTKEQLDGAMSHVAVWERVLGAGEIADLYAAAN